MKKLPFIVTMAALISTPALAGWNTEVSLSDAGHFYISSEDALNAANEELVKVIVSMDPEQSCVPSLAIFTLTEKPVGRIGTQQVPAGKFRIDRGEIHEFEAGTREVDNFTDDDGTVYGRSFSFFALDEQMLADITNGSKLIYTHEGIKTYRWSLESSAAAIKGLAEQCQLYSVDEWGNKYGSDSPRTGSTSDNSEWSL